MAKKDRKDGKASRRGPRSASDQHRRVEREPVVQTDKPKQRYGLGKGKTEPGRVPVLFRGREPKTPEELTEAYRQRWQEAVQRGDAQAARYEDRIRRQKAALDSMVVTKRETDELVAELRRVNAQLVEQLAEARGGNGSSSSEAF